MATAKAGGQYFEY